MKIIQQTAGIMQLAIFHSLWQIQLYDTLL